jgi:hypothetical protein
VAGLAQSGSLCDLLRWPPRESVGEPVGRVGSPPSGENPAFSGGAWGVFVRVEVTEEFPFLVTKMLSYYDRRFRKI